MSSENTALRHLLKEIVPEDAQHGGVKTAICVDEPFELQPIGDGRCHVVDADII